MQRIIIIMEAKVLFVFNMLFCIYAHEYTTECGAGICECGEIGLMSTAATTRTFVYVCVLFIYKKMRAVALCVCCLRVFVHDAEKLFM